VLLLFSRPDRAAVAHCLYPVRTLAEILPFRGMVGFPVELLLGRVTLTEALTGWESSCVGNHWPRAAPRVWRAGVRVYSAVGAMSYLRFAGGVLPGQHQGELAYRVNFLRAALPVAPDLAFPWAAGSDLSSPTPWRVAAGRSTDPGGGLLLVGGMIGLVIQPGMEEFIGTYAMGRLDFTLTKPEDAQFLVSIRRWKSGS